MFTGIVEERGRVLSMPSRGHAGKLVISCKRVLEDAHVGDSICTNGVCLTVVEMTHDSFSADVMPQTLSMTALGELTVGAHVNLERAMAANGRFGGHIVSGHIDGVGKISRRVPDQNAIRLTIRTTPQITALIVAQGSIAIDGVSLTVTTVGADSFEVSIIPHTGEETGLLEKSVGDAVNLENDIVGKYVQRLMSVGAVEAPDERSDASGKPGFSGAGNSGAGQSGITMDFLARNGF